MSDESKIGARVRAQAWSYARAARTVVQDVFHSGQPADRVLNTLLRESPGIGGQDRRTISATVFGVFRWWGWLAQLPGMSAAGPLEDADDAAWSRIFFAAQALESVELSAVAREWAAGAGVEGGRSCHAGDLGARAQAFGELFRLPVEVNQLVPGWVQSEAGLAPGDFCRLIEFLQRRPPVWVRLQRDPQAALSALRQDGLEVVQSEYFQTAVRLGRERLNLSGMASYRDGLIEVQDFASQVVGHIGAGQPGESWWDVCAGGGGKTLHLAAQLRETGSVLATDVREAKLREIGKRADRAGLRNIQIACWDGCTPPERPQGFDGVLVDAPCTGSGTWRRNPDARWTLRPEEVAERSGLQRSILNCACRTVKPAGAMVYATCSLFPRENRGVVDTFLAAHPEFSLEPFRNPFTGSLTDGCLQIQSWDGDCDAMFVARMRRRTV